MMTAQQSHNYIGFANGVRSSNTANYIEIKGNDRKYCTCVYVNPANGGSFDFMRLYINMAKQKIVKLGKVVKRKDENRENKFTLSIKQLGKLTGAQQRQLKADIEEACRLFLQRLYAPSDENKDV